VLLIAGCDSGPDNSKIKGIWAGPLGSVLNVTDDKWIVSTGVLDVTLNYKVLRADGDAIVVAVTSEGAQKPMEVTCRVAGDSLRISQPVNSTFALGGSWMRK
jgi:hypothetical protein